MKDNICNSIFFFCVIMIVLFMISFLCCDDGLAQTPTPTQTPTFHPTPIIGVDGRARAEYVGGGKVVLFVSPIWHRDSRGILSRNELSFAREESDLKGKNHYKFEKRNISMDISEESIVLHSDQDWQYPDRVLSVAYKASKWTGKPVDVNKTPLRRSANFIRSGSRVVQIEPGFAREYLPVLSSNFEIQYTINSSDLLCNCQQGEAGEYTFVTPGGKPRYRIYPPKITDASFSIIHDAGTFSHSLIHVNDDQYLYTKTGTITSPDAKWVDVDLVFASNTDNTVYSVDAVYLTALNSGDGDDVYNIANQTTHVAQAFWGVVNKYYIDDYLCKFDLSSIAAVSSASLKLYVDSIYYSAMGIVVNKADDWGAAVDVTDYREFTSIMGIAPAPSSPGWLTVELDPSLLTFNGTTHIYVRPIENALQIPPPATPGVSDGNGVMIRSGNYADPTYWPHLELTVQTPTPTPTVTPTVTPVVRIIPIILEG